MDLSKSNKTDYNEDSPRSNKEEEFSEIKLSLKERLNIHDIDSVEIDLGYFKQKFSALYKI